MSLEAELPDGTVLEFPDDTHSDVVKASARKYMGKTPAAPAPETGSRIADAVRGAANFLDWPARAAAAVPLAAAEAIKTPGYDIARDFPESLSTLTESGHMDYKGPKDVAADKLRIANKGSWLSHFLGEDVPDTGEKIALGEVPEHVVGKLFGKGAELIHSGANAVFEGKLPYQIGKDSPIVATALETLGNLGMFAPMAGRRKSQLPPVEETKPSAAEQMQAVRPEEPVLAKEIQNAIDAGKVQASDSVEHPRTPALVQAEGLDRNLAPAVDAESAVAGDRVQQGEILSRAEQLAAAKPQTEPYAGYTPHPDLNEGERALETKFGNELSGNLDAKIAEYKKRFGNVLNTDDARELSTEYRADRSRSLPVHEPASAFVKEVYKRELQKPAELGKENTVLFTAGGTGAGKTSGIKSIDGLTDLAKRAQIVYDGNMNSFASAKAKIDQALAAGKGVSIVYVHRDPIKALIGEPRMGGALSRAAGRGQGRTVPLIEHARTHAGSRDTIERIAKEYADNKMVKVFAVDHTEPGRAHLTAVESLPRYNVDHVHEALKVALDKEYAAGRVSDKIYAATARRAPPKVLPADGGNAREESQQPGDELLQAAVERPRKLAEDLPEQAKYLDSEARARGFDDADALFRDKPREFNKLAEAWRNEHELEVGVSRNQTNTPEFKRWFGESKVVDAEGKPLMVYHGTGADVARFDENFSGESTHHPSSALGFWFSEHPAVASDFAPDQTFGDSSGPNVVPSLLSIKNPYRMNWSEFDRLFLKPNKSNVELADRANEVAASLIQAGHDGIQVVRKRGADRGTEVGETSWVAFKPEQIKSAIGNRGTFSEKSGNIVETRGGDIAAETFDKIPVNDAKVTGEIAKLIDDKVAANVDLDPAQRRLNPAEADAISKAVRDVVNAGMPQHALDAVGAFAATTHGTDASFNTVNRSISVDQLPLKAAVDSFGGYASMIRGWLSHEITHALDHAPTAGERPTKISNFISVNSPRFDFAIGDNALMLVGHGDLMKEALGVWERERANPFQPGSVGAFLNYPFVAEFANPKLFKVELFAQLGRLYHSNPDLMRKELPLGYDAMKEIFDHAGSSLEETRAAIRATLRTPGATASLAKAVGRQPEQRQLFQATRRSPDLGEPGERVVGVQAGTEHSGRADRESVKERGFATLSANPMFDPGILKRLAKGTADDLTDLGNRTLGEFANELQLKAAPMAAGTDRARAIAKDYANAERLSRYQWGQFDEILKKNFNRGQLKKMWEAADEENLLRETKVPEAQRKGKGLDKLDPKEKEVLGLLHEYGERLLQRARDAGLFKGEGVKYWSPRVVAMIGEDGTVTQPKVGEGVGSPYTSPSGRNITTSASSLRGRKHLTLEETEEAAQAKFGGGAKVIRDIRVMPMAMARIERAIAGRELINGIKDVGKGTGQELVSDGEGPGFFTIDHPAFKTYKPKFIEQDGKMVPETNQKGEIVMHKTPIYVSKEFEGPLKAIMSDTPGKVYSAMMSLKAKTMGLIMYSPLIHNAVEWGRALPVLPGKVLSLKVYFEGNAAKNDPAQMREAISNGLVPIGKRFQNQDISGIMEEPDINPGRSLTAKAIGGATGLVNKKAGEAVKRGIDAAGDFWHNTLLWDRIGDLQMGLYTNVRDSLVKKGTDDKTAGRIAAHFANRYAGALPNEAMSAAVRKAANFVLFSRTFTLGNLGVMKDILTGLPRDVKAQIERDSGRAAVYAAKGIAQRKALTAFTMDIALMYAGTAALQSGLEAMQQDKTLDDIEKGYVRRFSKLMQRVKEAPSELLNPFLALDQLSPTSENEPGKERRALVGYDDKGTAIYVRVPTGKIGEEFLDWGTSPLDILKRKEGTLMRPLVQTLTNDKGFGRRVYDPDAPGFKGAAKAVGNVMWNIASNQFPMDTIEAASDIVRGKSEDLDAYKVIGPLFGLTFSKGAPGGPEVGTMFAAERRHRAEISDAMPEIKKMLKHQEYEEAVSKMEDAGMTPAEVRATLKFAEVPAARLTSARLRKFSGFATEHERGKLEQQMENRR